MVTRTGWLRWCLAMAAALLLCQGRAGAVEATVENGVLTLSGGDVAFSIDPAEERITVRVGDATISGGGALLKVSRGKDGGIVVADLAKAQGPVTVSEDDIVVARGRLHDALPLVGVALWDGGGGATTLPVPLAALGFPEDAVVGGFDIVEDEFFGPVSGALARAVGGGQCKLLTLAQATGQPVLLCTSATLAVGAEDVSNAQWDAQASVLSGTAQVAKEERFELRILAPPEPQRWVAEAATVSDADQQAGVKTLVMQTGPWLRVYVTSPEARGVEWQVTFARKPAREVAAGQVRLVATASEPQRVDLACYGIDGDVVVRRNDGVELACSGQCSDTTVEPSTEYTYTAFPLSWAGRKPAVATAKVKTPAPPPMAPLPTLYLSDLRPVKAVNGWNGDPRRDLSIEDNPIRLRGMVFKRGIGCHALAEIVYKARSNYTRFVATVGLDDEKDSGSVTFEVYADDKPLFKSGTVTRRDPWKIVDVALPKGTKLIRLVVGDAGDGIGCDHADWANAGFITEGEAEPEQAGEK